MDRNFYQCIVILWISPGYVQLALAASMTVWIPNATRKRNDFSFNGVKDRALKNLRNPRLGAWWDRMNFMVVSDSLLTFVRESVTISHLPLTSSAGRSCTQIWIMLLWSFKLCENDNFRKIWENWGLVRIKRGNYARTPLFVTLLSLSLPPSPAKLSISQRFASIEGFLCTNQISD